VTDTIRPASPASIVGVFLVILGAGVILDGEWLWRGLASMAAGASCFVQMRRRDGATT
jgi:hypothetical protein